MKGRFYRPELDALRFFAFCAVYCDHIALPFRWWPIISAMGRYGLPLFFLLSAYLIVALLLREIENTGQIAVRAFFVRRALRIWPLYFLVLAVGAVAGHFYRPAHLPRGALLSMTFLVGNLWLIRHGWKLIWANPLWSLSVEEQFYLVVPAFVQRVGRRPRTLAVACGLVLATSYVSLFIIGLRRGDPSLDVWCNSFVAFQFFAAGALLALWFRDRKLSVNWTLRVILSAGGLALWWVAARFGHLLTSSPLPLKQLLGGNLCVLLGTSSLFVSVLDIKQKIPNLLLYLGKISFGLYVFHNIWLWVVYGTPFQNLLPRAPGMRPLAAPLLTLVTAMLSYRFYESPFLRLKRRFERIHTRAV